MQACDSTYNKFNRKIMTKYNKLKNGTNREIEYCFGKGTGFEDQEPPTVANWKKLGSGTITSHVTDNLWVKKNSTVTNGPFGPFSTTGTTEYVYAD